MTAASRTRTRAGLPRDALKALHWVDQNPMLSAGSHDPWVQALLTIGWAIEAQGRLKLTSAGRHALSDMLAERAVYARGPDPAVLH